MPPAKHPQIALNGRRLGDVLGRTVPRDPGAATLVGFPASEHSCIADGDRFVIRTQLLTLLQLFVEGVLVADPGRPVMVSVGRARAFACTIESIVYDEDRWSRQIAVVTLRRVAPTNGSEPSTSGGD